MKLKTSRNPSTTLYGHGVEKGSMYWKSTFKTTVASAVNSFNDGAKKLLLVFYQLGMETDYYTIESCTRAILEQIKKIRL